MSELFKISDDSLEFQLFEESPEQTATPPANSTVP